MISRITGVPAKEADEARFRELAREVLSGISPLLDAEGRARTESAILELCDWVRELCEERRREPQEDLISDLVHDETGGGMSIGQIELLVAGLVAAGTETTSAGGTLALRTLFQHPDWVDRFPVFAPEDWNRRYVGPTLYVFSPFLVPQAFAGLGEQEVPADDYIPSGNPYADSFAHHFPDLRTRGLRCGHFIPEEAPEQTTALLTDFLAGRI